MTNAGGDTAQATGPIDAMDIVELRDHDPAWKEEFRRERERLISALGTDIRRIDHVGSTAVPGLKAKPVIDILASVERLDPELFASRLAVLGYVHVPIGEEERLFFRKGMPRTHHLHLVLEGGEEFRRHILFRDRLIAHSEEARRYAVLKEELAERFRNDREAYIRGKEDFISEILAKAEELVRASGLDWTIL